MLIPSCPNLYVYILRVQSNHFANIVQYRWFDRTQQTSSHRASNNIIYEKRKNKFTNHIDNIEINWACLMSSWDSIKYIGKRRHIRLFDCFFFAEWTSQHYITTIGKQLIVSVDFGTRKSKVNRTRKKKNKKRFCTIISLMMKIVQHERERETMSLFKVICL